ncbi:MAG TPA: SRPBCC domain-containing protein [Candidatus Binataceae bacterium]|nr:SRPBCC domain-containing protein [Candidatus Binataceae bacterium]
MNLIDLTVTRIIPAPPERIFDVWIDPKSPGGPWFGGERVIVNPVVDGLFYIAAKNQDRIWPHYGRFIQLDRPRKIEFTWVSEATKGAESVVTLTMEPRGNDTEVTLRHAGVPDDEMGRKHKDGWAWILSMLEQGMAARRKASS